ncbi:peptidoglycan DD-metalloendopeptidase family protein [Polymorphospora lycopeni]|uniref:M23 family metallopeptidase n=1 Tax=Polymorphospora lycopeni TaxID=3140240 RepID=A0ABV5CW70_9ACTN
MDSYRMFRHVALVATVFAVMLASACPVNANPRDDQKRIEAEMARAGSILEGATERAQQAAKLLAAANGAMPAAQNLVAQRRGEVAAAETAASTARRKADEAQGALKAATARYAESERQVEAARARAAGFVVANYKGSDLATVNMLLAARGLLDAADRYGYFERIMSTEKAAIDALTDARLDAKQSQNEATLARQAAETARIEADRALADARAAQAQAEAAAAQVVALTTQRTEALAIAEQERGASLAKYEEAKREAARIEAELAAWEARQVGNRPGGNAAPPPVKPGARFLMPVRGWKSSDYGMRFDPYYRVWQLHAGVDIAAGGGQPIHAAADGTVIRAGWNGGYGNYTCLSHGRSGGKGLSTCYAHQSSIGVRAGQYVRRGQVIGRVGTTGASTGNHLHFEVRLNGSPTNPLSWLPGCLC